MDQQNMNKDADEYGQPCGSPKAKKIFINMLDQMQNSPKSKSQQQKMKHGEEKSMNLSSPSSYHSSSPSSTSSLSSTPNPHHQKQPMTHGTMNGSMNELLNLPTFSHLQQMPPGISPLQHRSTPLTMSGMNPGSPLMTGGVLLGLGLPQSPQLPQLILTSGQLVQGIQGAQVLIPTPQGITSQTILTIPVSQQLPTNLSIDQLIQSLSNITQKQHQQQQQNEHMSASATSTNHVLSNVPNLSPNPILLNSHLLASGAQQLLSIQPQLMAFQQHHQQQQQQLPENHLFYRHKSHHQMDASESHSRNQFKMRSREMSKRLSRLSRGINGHNSDMMGHQMSQDESVAQMSSMNRIPTTNGETPLNSSKHHQAQHSSPHHSPKAYHASPSPPQQKLEIRAMRELLADEMRGSESHYSHHIDQNERQRHEESPSKQRRQSCEKEAEKNERESPFESTSQQQQSCSMPVASSPVNLSNDSNSGDEKKFDKEGQDDPNMSQQLPEGIDLDEINEFAQAFKLQRLSLGLTQTQVGQALSVTEGPAYSQSAICSALAARMYAAVQLSSQQQQMFEKLDITPKSAQKIKPVLEQWMKEAKGRFKMGDSPLTDFMGVENSKKRKRRTSFTPHALEILNSSFERNTHPSGTDITALANALGYEREVIRIWFCNKRQALKNTVRMMSKGMPN